MNSNMVPISDLAIVVSPDDNVAVVKSELPDGTEVELSDGRMVVIKTNVPPGHRFATRTIPAGEFVRQYGQPIGTSLGIECGDWIRHENMSDDVPVIRELPPDLQMPAPVYLSEERRGTFMGFHRPDGRVGTRNF